MRRADRLFQLVGLLQRRRTVTAAALAERLEISERTVYRDIRDLIASGVPIQGEAGVGYRLERGFDLPPLMFNQPEIEAIVLGLRLVDAFADHELSSAADAVLDKIRAVVPPKLLEQFDETRLYGYDFGSQTSIATTLTSLRQAVRSRCMVRFGYDDARNQSSTRTVRPLALSFLGHAWALTGWCELRSDFRNFRLDRIRELTLTGEPFQHEPGKRFEDFMRSMNESGQKEPRGSTH